ncbi:hypothetical protein D3C80_1716350 [compost metagenome]
MNTGENVPGVFQIAAAGLGQTHAAGCTQQQFDPELLFQGADGAGDGGRRNVQTAGSRGEAFQLADGDEYLHQVDLVHAGS